MRLTSPEELSKELWDRAAEVIRVVCAEVARSTTGNRQVLPTSFQGAVAALGAFAAHHYAFIHELLTKVARHWAFAPRGLMGLGRGSTAYESVPTFSRASRRRRIHRRVAHVLKLVSVRTGRSLSSSIERPSSFRIVGAADQPVGLRTASRRRKRIEPRLRPRRRPRSRACERLPEVRDRDATRAQSAA